jgi:hypothetical protein
MSEHGDDEEDMNEVIEVMDSDEAMEQHSDEEA